MESSRRDLHNALLCTVLNAQNFRQKSLKILLIFSPNFGEFDKFSLVFAQILPDFCRIFAIRPRRNVQGTGRVPGGYPGGSPQFAFSRKLPHTAPPKKLASSSARPGRPLSATLFSEPPVGVSRYRGGLGPPRRTTLPRRCSSSCIRA